ncbi:MAG TPA: endolytic transglycosylase MltG [Rhodanobacteraceae bacterium]|nr:endolytic transglycosylase MltG [Rhodanobacteraceae bacterium]
MIRGDSPSMQRGGALAIVLILIVLVAIAAAAWFGFDYLRFRDGPLAVQGTNQTFEIAKGESFREIVRDLRKARLSSAPPLYWRALAEQLGVAGSLHAGEYALTPGITPRTLLENMAHGNVLQRRVTFVEGWTFRQVRAALAAAPKLAQTGAELSDAELMTKIGAGGQNPEGEFMPDTYDYVLGMSDIDVLKRAQAAMQSYLDAQWQKRDPSVPLQTPYEALILASIVEKETAQPNERPQIAGVFERRLKLGMKLETDPTVIYGLGASYDGRIHTRDLQTDTPYNTYTRTGLPPTPIALPGRAAIDAVLHPAPGDTLYFVARGDGTHAFSSTLAEHNRNVAIYQLHRDPDATPAPSASVSKPASNTSGAKRKPVPHKSRRSHR